MIGKYKYQIITKEFSDNILKEDLKELINICRDHKIVDINVLFGYAWSDLFYNKEIKNIKMNDLLIEVENAEKGNYGRLGEDDLSLYFKDFDIRYCHHGDIHLIYNEIDALTQAIINNWKRKKWELKKS